jgi:hypothetical protein
VNLEELRANDIGSIKAWVVPLGDTEQAMTHLTFPSFCTNAFYLSAQQIEHLEFSSNVLHQGNSVQAAVGMWFISIESFINSLLRICCLLKNQAQSFDHLKTKDFGARVSELLNLLEIDRLPFYRGPFQRLEEFKTYRNELFHDRTTDRLLTFNKTSFSGNPMYANQVDIMQAALIATEVFQSFRYVISGIDLMPQVHVNKESSFFYLGADDLFLRVLKPHFESSLRKHSLTSTIELDLAVTSLEKSRISLKGEVQIIIKHLADERYSHTPSQEKTVIGKTLFDTIKSEQDFDVQNTFRLPNYNL